MLRANRYPYLRLFFLLMPVAGLTMALMRPSGPTKPLASDFSFIRTDLNVIDNNLRGLKGFYEQLQRLEKGEINTVRVVHIGDSHIQADGFPERFRLSFHQKFGARGRGLVFPYQVAKTTSPPDIRSYSNASWMSRRNIYAGGPLPIGLAGITMRTNSASYSLKLSVTGNDRGIDYGFDKVTLFSEKGPRNLELDALVTTNKAPQRTATEASEAQTHVVEGGEILSLIAARYRCTVEDLQEWNGLQDETIYAGQKLLIKAPGPGRAIPTSNRGTAAYPVKSNPYSHFSSTIQLDQPVTSISLRGKRGASQQSQSMIYGMVLENTRNTGILYHMAGVNGAKYESFNASRNFIEQVSELTPDLIIISLGTNEAISGGFSPGSFYRELDQLVTALEQNMPYASILITTPPDTYLSRKYKNPNGTRAKDLLYNYSLNNDLACWNLFNIMGGEGAMELWYRNGLAQNDRIHFTWKGYGIQGDLLFEALMNGYGAFQSYRPR